jgi:anaerobic ribonucleoside-triphosphate reductase
MMTQPAHECQHCGNRHGFVCGICIECGWGEIEGDFVTVRVNVDDLPERVRESLVARHAQRTRDLYRIGREDLP